MSLAQCNRREGTIKQRAFVRSLFDINNPRTFGNLTQSARKAHYKGSDGVLANVGWQNVRKLQVIKMAESLVNSILSTDGVEAEITSIATTHTEVDGAMRMKALDLLTKIKGMQVQRVESTDTTERDASVIAITESIERAVTRSQSSPDAAAIQLYNSLDSSSPARDLAHWGKYADIIRADQRERAAQAVEPKEVGGEM